MKLNDIFERAARLMGISDEFFAENDTAAYVFDFIGGSEVSRSDGKMTEMSVLTEAEDLDAVIDYFRGDERFAEGKLFLFGGSQGGRICLYTAGKRPGDIAGLVALYPALNLQDICRHAQEEAKAGEKS